MSNADTVVKTIERGGVVPVVRLSDLSQAVDLARALLDGGVTALELTMTSPGALEGLAQLRREVTTLRDNEAVLGMGSVVGADAAVAAIDAGAAFIVSPVLDHEVIDVCRRRSVPVMPAGLTPTEIQEAWAAGAALVKVFPAHHFGATYFKDLLAPLPHLRLMPTGGVTLENLSDYIRNGAVAVGVGSSLVDGALIKAGEWSTLSHKAETYVKRVQIARGSR